MPHIHRPNPAREIQKTVSIDNPQSPPIRFRRKTLSVADTRVQLPPGVEPATLVILLQEEKEVHSRCS